MASRPSASSCSSEIASSVLMIRFPPRRATRVRSQKKGKALAASFPSATAMPVRQCISGQRGLGFFRQRGEGSSIADGQIGQHLAVDLHVSLVQTVDEAAVGQAVEARGSVDARDPERAELALALPAVTICILSRLGHPLLGDPEGLAAHVVITLRLRQHLLVAGPGGDTTLYSGHRYSPGMLGLALAVTDTAACAPRPGYRLWQSGPGCAAGASAWSLSWSGCGCDSPACA